jgi:predicted nuclease of predicted toxin-antitoxin system
MDASVPDSVGNSFAENGHNVIHHREVLPDGVPDEMVCATALRNDAILVAIDNDMRRLARRYGTGPNHDRFKQLSLIRIGCNPALAAKRVEQAMSLIEHEWAYAGTKAARRLWVDIEPHAIRSHR